MHRSRPWVVATLALFGSSCADAALPGGWTVRMDAVDDPLDTSRFRDDEGGLEVLPGPNATLWHPDRTASGSYRLSADVTHLDSGEHPHGAGLTFGGTDVHGVGQAYTYFLVRSDGRFLIKTREGDDTRVIAGWADHESISREDEIGMTDNRLAVEVGESETRFLVNDAEVYCAPSASLRVAGQYGFRLVHDLHVSFGPPEFAALPN